MYRQRRNAWLSANGPCRKCGSKKKLEIDHINPKTKVSHVIWLWPEARRIAELKKCQVLCRKCHIQKTIKDNPFMQPRHGTTNMYKVHGCRCEDCRTAKREQQRSERVRRKAREEARS